MIRLKLLVLYLLNVTDAILTYFLLKTGYFYEANFFLKNIAAHTPEFLSIKILVPGFLCILLSVRLRHATEKQIYLGNIPINIVMMIYILTNIFHIFGTIYAAVASG